MRTIARSFGHVARLGVVLGLAPLLLAALVPIDALDPPAEPPYVELLASRAETLRFHLGVVLCVCLGVLLLLRWWRFAALGALLAAWAMVPALVWPQVDRVPDPAAVPLRLLSVNLGDDGGDKEAILAEVLRSKASVVLLLEYTPEWRDYMKGRLTEEFPFRHERARMDNFGMAVLSDQTWAQMDSFVLHDTGTPQMRFELSVGGNPVVIYSLHLLPPGSSNYGSHRAEFAGLVRRLGAETKPVVLAGDFNFVDHGRLAESLHELGYYDAHGIAAGGRGVTWPMVGPLRHAPGIRIDHVYVGPGLTATEAWVGRPNGSDHLAVGAAIVPTRK